MMQHPASRAREREGREMFAAHTQPRNPNHPPAIGALGGAAVVAAAAALTPLPSELKVLAVLPAWQQRQQQDRALNGSKKIAPPHKCTESSPVYVLQVVAAGAPADSIQPSAAHCLACCAPTHLIQILRPPSSESCSCVMAAAASSGVSNCRGEQEGVVEQKVGEGMD
jgi:hypothetical protein